MAEETLLVSCIVYSERHHQGFVKVHLYWIESDVTPDKDQRKNYFRFLSEMKEPLTQCLERIPYNDRTWLALFLARTAGKLVETFQDQKA